MFFIILFLVLGCLNPVLFVKLKKGVLLKIEEKDDFFNRITKKWFILRFF